MLSRRRGSVRQIWLLLILPLLFTAVAAVLYWGWQIVWQAAPWSPQFSLHPAHIEIVSESPWVDRNAILQQVVHEASLDDQLSLLDPGLNERLSLAIEDHPWVESVERVEKFQPPRVLVTLQYREPVALIAEEPPSSAVVGRAADICIVDRHGVRLPVDESLTTSSTFQSLARIEGVPFRPPPPGEVWKDGRILGGAKIAAALHGDWHLFSLQAIRPSPQPVIGSSESYIFELITQGGTRIPWGPEYVGGEEPRDREEPTASDKANRLRAYVRDHGIDLDGHRVGPPPEQSPGESSGPKESEKASSP